MVDFFSAIIVFLLLCCSAAFGMAARPRLPAVHRDQETAQTVALITGMLVTLSALVLGLLTASVKAQYDKADHNRQEYALQLTLLDQTLRDYGPEGDAARADIRSYTAGVIASTWPSEPPPVGVRYPDTSTMPRVGATPLLATLMQQVGSEISRFTPTPGVPAILAQNCRETYRDVMRARLTVIEDINGNISTPFFRILVFWLMIVFANFGLIAPRHSLSIVSITLCAISLSSAVFVIVDLSRPYVGLFGIHSESMRAALAAMVKSDH